jgi:hypothetical protein
MRRPSLYQAQLLFLGGLALLALVAGAWAALAPLPALPKERVIVIPRGAASLGPQPFPSDIRLTLGLQDVLVLRNEDDRAQLVGGIEVAAGQSLSIPFYRVQDFQLACSAHPSGQLRITVSARPDPGLGRLWWRLARLRGYLSFRSSQGAAYG